MRTQTKNMTDKLENGNLMTQEEIESLLEVVEEEDLKPTKTDKGITMEDVSNVFDDNKTTELMSMDEIEEELGIKPVKVETLEYSADVLINGVKAKKVTASRMKEIIKSINTNTVKSIRFYYFDVLTGGCATDVGVKINDRYYVVVGAMFFQDLISLKLEAIRADLEVEEEFNMKVSNGRIIYSYGAIVTNQVEVKGKQ